MLVFDAGLGLLEPVCILRRQPPLLTVWGLGFEVGCWVLGILVLGFGVGFRV